MLAEGQAPVSMIKIDVEGYELKVMRGIELRSVLGVQFSYMNSTRITCYEQEPRAVISTPSSRALAMRLAA